MNRIPIKIDLSVFFCDERQKVLLMFNPEWKTVECLQKRVETLFNLESVRFLSDDGCFIPPEESIEVIKFSPGLKVFINNNDGTSQKKKCKKERKAKAAITEPESEAVIEVDLSNDIDADVKKKRKYRSLQMGFASSTPNRSAKRIKNDVHSINAAPVCHQQRLTNKPSEISSTSEQMPPPPEPPHTSATSTKSKLTKKQSRVSSLATASSECNKESTHSSKSDLINASDLNHSRSTPAEANSIIEDGEVTALEDVRPKSLLSSTCINESKMTKKKKRSATSKNPFKNSIPNTKHIHYDESGEITTTTATSPSPDPKEVEAETKVRFQCALNERDTKKPRIFEIQHQQVSRKSCEIEIQENIILSPLDIQTILNKSPILEAASQKELQVEGPAKSLSISAGSGKKEINKTDLNTLEDQNSAVEGNCSLYDSNSTETTTIATNKRISSKVPVNKISGDESSNIEQPNQTNDDDEVSMNQTANSENKEINGDESSNIQPNQTNDDDDDVCMNQTTNSENKENNGDESSNIQPNQTNDYDVALNQTTNSDNKGNNGDESPTIQTNQSNDDDDDEISMNQTTNSEKTEISIVKEVNESSVVSVDCVDLSIDLDEEDDCKMKSHRKSCKTPDSTNYDSSDVEEVSEVIDLNETEDASNSFIHVGSKTKYGDIKLCKIMPFCIKLTQLPEVGDIVVFKVPYSNAKDSVCTTNFLAGEAHYINKRTKSIKMLILDGHAELRYVPGKYHTNLDDSMSVQKYVQMKSSEMIEPKIWRKK